MKSIIQELTAHQQEDGWLSLEALQAIAARLEVPLHRVESVSTFYTHFRRTPPKKVQISVCRDLSCMLAGGSSARKELEARLSSREDVEIEEVSCLGRCEVAPACHVGHRTVPMGNGKALMTAIEDPVSSPYRWESRRWAADVYDSAADHYGTLRRVLADSKADRIVPVLKESGLRGMGGAGFPTGVKWELVSKEASTPKYVVCNADESEPGTFKDRVVLHDLPHLILEGMALGALAVGAERGWVFIRHEYDHEREQIENALAKARSIGALGKNIFGSNFHFDVEIFVSPGGYILGEETALLECMEDRRGEPRNKPPFPGKHGLHGQPTLINNVETFAHCVGIIAIRHLWR